VKLKGGGMTFYADSKYPVNDELSGAHALQFEKFAQAGTWGTADQRLAVIAEARQAGIEAGLLEAPEDGGAESTVTLPEELCAVIRTLAVDCKAVDMETYQRARAAGLSDPEYAELVAIVSFVVDLDVFARGIGVPLRPFRDPQPGNPLRDIPEEAVPEKAFVPTIPNVPDCGPFGTELYGGHFKPYIMRGLSLVPDEYRAHVALEQAQYNPLPKVPVVEYCHHAGLTRPQVEVVAGRVSALNDCFY
jgi:alkylhydroperoxidase family enzyme